MNVFTRRRQLLGSLAGIGLIYPLLACGKGLFMSKEVTLNVVLFSYLDRPIFDVYLDGGDIGLAGPYGGGHGVMTGVTVPFGPQTLTWRLGGPRGMLRNGETVTMKNSLILTKEQIPADAQYLGVHIYPDDTAELTFTKYLPDPTPRGEAIYKGKHVHGR